MESVNWKLSKGGDLFLIEWLQIILVFGAPAGQRRCKLFVRYRRRKCPRLSFVLFFFVQFSNIFLVVCNQRRINQIVWRPIKCNKTGFSGKRERERNFPTKNKKHDIFPICEIFARKWKFIAQLLVFSFGLYEPKAGRLTVA